MAPFSLLIILLGHLGLRFSVKMFPENLITAAIAPAGYIYCQGRGCQSQCVCLCVYQCVSLRLESSWRSFHEMIMI